MLEQKHRRLLWLLAVACFSEGYDFALLTVALPQVRKTFHLTHTEADLWIALLYLGALPALIWGRRADSHGRRHVLLIAIVGYTVASAVTATSPVIGMYVACQLVARCFIATQVAVAWTMAAEDMPAERRGLGFGVLALASAMGTGFCSIIQAVAISPLHASWRWLYVIALVFLLIVMFLRRELPESDRYLALDRRVAGHQPASLLMRRPFVGPLLLVCVTVLVCNLTTEAVVFSIDFLETQRHLSASAANLLLVAAGAVALPVLVIAGRLSDRIGRRRVCITGLVIQSAGLLVFFIAARGTLQLGLALGLVYLGLFAAWTTGTAFAVEMFPTSLRGAASAAAAIAKLLGQSASFAIGAALLTITHRPDATIGVLVIGPIAGALLIAFFLPETSRQELTDVVPLPSAEAVGGATVGS